MKLVPEWRRIVRRAWSMRLIGLAALLTGIEAALPLFSDRIPRGPFAVASFLSAAAALWARLVAQPSMNADDDQPS